MSKTIVLAEHKKLAAVYENDTIITDLIIERGPYQIGDIYIGVVETVLPSINAAFIILDYSENNGFIHANKLGHLKKNKTNKNIARNLFSKSIVMVQILKEPTGRKGPTVTGEISIKGKYITLLPFEEGIFFSKNLSSHEDLSCLKTVLSLLKPKSLGIFIKKDAYLSNLENVIRDFYSLLYEWDKMCKDVNTGNPPFLISRNKNFISKILQKVYTNEISHILVDSYKESKKIASIAARWAHKNNLFLSIKYFDECEFCIRDYNLDLIIYDLLQPRVNLIGGGYIVIQKTEAFITIDVNSGSFNYLNTPRETNLLVNKKAAKQIAKHIKLRNLSGVIIVDFIDMKNQKDQLELLLYFDLFLKQDDEKPRIIQFSELGLVELTRKRQGKRLDEMFFLSSFSTLNLSPNNYLNASFKYSSGHSLFLNTFAIYSF